MIIFSLLASTVLSTAAVQESRTDEPILLAQGETVEPIDPVLTTPPAQPAVTEPEPIVEVPLPEASPVDAAAPAMSEGTIDYEDVLAEPLPQGEDFAPDDSLLMEPLPPFPDEVAGAGAADRLTIEPPPEPEFALKDRIAFRKLRTRALADPGVQAALIRSREVNTDREKRDALREYYTLMFKRMRAMDKSVVEKFSDLEAESLAALEQRRVAPSVAPPIDGTGAETTP